MGGEGPRKRALPGREQVEVATSSSTALVPAAADRTRLGHQNMFKLARCSPSATVYGLKRSDCALTVRAERKRNVAAKPVTPPPLGPHRTDSMNQNPILSSLKVLSRAGKRSGSAEGARNVQSVSVPSCKLQRTGSAPSTAPEPSRVDIPERETPQTTVVENSLVGASAGGSGERLETSPRADAEPALNQPANQQTGNDSPGSATVADHEAPRLTQTPARRRPGGRRRGNGGGSGGARARVAPQPAATVPAQPQANTSNRRGRIPQGVPAEVRSDWSRTVVRCLEDAVDAATYRTGQHAAQRIQGTLRSLADLPERVLADKCASRSRARRILARLKRMGEGLPLDDEEDVVIGPAHRGLRRRRVSEQDQLAKRIERHVSGSPPRSGSPRPPDQ